MQRLRSATRISAVLVGVLVAISSGAVREFVWADLKEGLLDLKGLSRPLRAVVWIGFLLLVLAALLLVFSDTLRQITPMSVISGGATGRGTLIPQLLAPITLFLLAVAWSFILAGSLHSHWSVRVGALALFLSMLGSWMLGSMLATTGPLEQALAWGPLIAITLFAIWRWFRNSAPLSEFLILLLLVTTSFGSVQIQLVSLWRYSDTPLLLTILQADIFTFAGLVLPFLLLIGLDIAEFVYAASTWVAGITAHYGGRRGVTIAIVLALLLQWWATVQNLASRLAGEPLTAVALSYASALPVLLVVAALWRLLLYRRRIEEGDLVESAKRSAPWFVVVFLGGNLVVGLLLLIGAAVLGAFDLFENLVRFLNGWMVEQMRNWFTYALLFALIWALRAWRSRQIHVAYYMGVLALVLLWGDVTSPERALGFLSWEGSETGLWWTLLVTAAGVRWWVQSRLTDARLASLLLVLVMLLLLQQTDFIENPFSPFFSFAGVGLLAFGILWDALTIGSWANRDSPRLPRISRIFLYVGYVLLSVTIVNWVLTSHWLSYVESFTGNAALGGLKILGRPLLYALFFLILFPGGSAQTGSAPSSTASGVSSDDSVGAAAGAPT